MMGAGKGSLSRMTDGGFGTPGSKYSWQEMESEWQLRWACLESPWSGLFLYAPRAPLYGGWRGSHAKVSG